MSKAFPCEVNWVGAFMEQTLDLCRKLKAITGGGQVYLILGPFSRDYGIKMSGMQSLARSCHVKESLITVRIGLL